jgi:hypothetical protein
VYRYFNSELHHQMNIIWSYQLWIVIPIRLHHLSRTIFWSDIGAEIVIIFYVFISGVIMCFSRVGINVFNKCSTFLQHKTSPNIPRNSTQFWCFKILGKSKNQHQTYAPYLVWQYIFIKLLPIVVRFWIHFHRHYLKCVIFIHGVNPLFCIDMYCN